MDELHVIQWLYSFIGTSSWIQMPQNYIDFSGQVKEGIFEKNVSQSIHAYFVLDNRYSSFSSKRVTLVVREEWDEQESSMDLVTTVPPQDRSLNAEVKRIIEDSKTNLKIISPYIDMLLLDELLNKHQQGINIQIITREKDGFAGKDKKDTFEHLKNNLKTNHKTNKSIHSRIIIKDEQEALVSSADLTYDSMIAQFNVGIMTSDTNIIRKLLEYFNNVWQKS